MKYFGETIINGEWEEAEKYLSAFTELDDNRYSRKLFFEVRKQKYCEALDRNDLAEAANILWRDLKVFSASEDKIYGQLAEIFALEKFRENEHLSLYVNTTSARAKAQGDLKTLAEQNPILQDKLVFPSLNKSALLSLINLICPNPEKKSRSVKEELIYLILQFLNEEKFTETFHKLEQETKIFFNMKYFGEFITNGDWAKAEIYLSAFTKLDDNMYSVKMFFEMRRLKYLEALDRNEHVEAVNILWKDLKVFSDFNNKIFNEFAEVFALKNFRQNELLSAYMDNASERANLLDAFKVLAEKNPLLEEKLKFPSMDKSRLLTIIKQTMDWWVPYRVNTMPKVNGGAISLENIPTVSYLCHSPSLVFSSQEAGVLPVPSAYGSHDGRCFADVNLRLGLQSTEKFGASLKTTCTSHQAGVLPEPSICEIARLVYSYSGDLIVALAQNAMHKLWMRQSDRHFSGEANANMPQLYQPSSGKIMINEIGTHLENAIPCFQLKDSCLFSASGGKISIFSLKTYEILASFATPPPATTYFTFLPRDIFAIGFDNSSILIHCPRNKKTIAKLKGHQKRITCLAFSHKLNVLVSSGADAQLCVWSANGWERQVSRFLQSLCTGQVLEPPVVNHIQFHQDQIQLLTVHERQIDIYEAPMLNHLGQLVPRESDLPITYATYSCNSQSIYISFKSGCIKVFATETLDLRCQINLTAYAQSIASLEVYPLVIAAHPSKPNQIALGLTNGGVHILEPLQPQGQWGIPPPWKEI